MLAADMGAGQAEFMAQEVAEQHAHADLAFDFLAVDGERHLDHWIVGALGDRRLDAAFHCRLPDRARSAAFATMRRISAPSARRRKLTEALASSDCVTSGSEAFTAASRSLVASALPVRMLSAS